MRIINHNLFDFGNMVNYVSSKRSKLVLLGAVNEPQDYLLKEVDPCTYVRAANLRAKNNVGDQ
jgi:hypothetical protein